MRLDEQEVQAIIKGIELYQKSKPMVLRLHGSRVKQDAKGGDIDLLLIVENTQEKEALNLLKHKILVEIKEEIGEQKIDLMILSKNDIQNDPLARHILSKSLVLKEWK